MKKFVGVLSFALVLALSQVVHAQDLDAGYLNISLFGGGWFSESSDVDSDWNIGARLTYDFTPYLEAGIETGWTSYDVDNRGAAGGQLGEIEFIPLYFILIGKYPLEFTDYTLVPYVLGGVGIVFWDSDASQPGVTDDEGEDYAFKLGGGADYYVTDNTAVFIEGGFQSWSTDLEIGNGVDSFYVSGGIKLSI